MGKFSGEIDRGVKRYLDGLNFLREEREGIMGRVSNIDKTVKETVEILDEFRGAMKRGEANLSDVVEDYAFFGYGADFEGKVEGIRKFLGEFEKYRGELILERESGHSYSSSQIVGGKLQGGHVDEHIVLGRLLCSSLRPYEITLPERELVAVTTDLEHFGKKTGWSKREQPLSIAAYLAAYVESYNRKAFTPYDQLVLIGALEKAAEEEGIEISKSPKEVGLRVGISTSLMERVNPEPRFGGNMTYDEEPHHLLIVGDAAVKKYLESKNLKVTTETTVPAAVPEI